MVALKNWFFRSPPVLPGFSLTFGFSTLYLFFVVLLPLSMLFLYLNGMSFSDYLDAVTDQRVVASYWLTGGATLCATLLASFFGLWLAWVLTRYEFPGRKTLDALIDLPFALPTIVSGLTLSLILEPNGWIGRWFAVLGVKLAYSPLGIVIALTFMGLPFVVRSLQPVLQGIDVDCIDAARTLGASSGQVFFRVILPSIFPAWISGASQSLVRGLGEFGTVVMISGNIPFKTEVSSMMVFTHLQEFSYASAVAIASFLLGVSLLILLFFHVILVRFSARD